MRRTTLVGVSAGVLVLGGTGPDTPVNLVRRANDAYRDGAISRALELYEKADELVPDDPTTLYDWGTALTAGDDRGLGERLLRKADSLAQSDEVRARARSNLGISQFVTGSALSEKDPHRSIELFESSAESARAALRLRPDDRQSRRQVEISRRAAKLIRDQLEMQQKLEDLTRQQREQSRQSRQEHERRREDDRQQPQPQDQPQDQQQDQPQGQQQDQAQDQQAKDEPTQDGQQHEGGQDGPEQRDEGSNGARPPIDLPSLLKSPASQDADQAGKGDDQSADESNQVDASEPGRDGEHQEGTEQGEPEQDQHQSDAQAGSGQGEVDQDSEPQPPQAPGGGSLDESQREISERTGELEQTLREAIDRDLVAGDKEFAQAMLRAIEEARKAQDAAEQDLGQQDFDKASGKQEQAASLLEMAQRLGDSGQSQSPPSDADQQPQAQDSGEGGGDEEPDPIAEGLLDKERKERVMRRDFQRRVMRGRRPPARDW